MAQPPKSLDLLGIVVTDPGGSHQKSPTIVVHPAETPVTAMANPFFGDFAESTGQEMSMQERKRQNTNELVIKRRASEQIRERTSSGDQRYHLNSASSRHDHGKVVLPHEVSLADDWSTPAPKETKQPQKLQPPSDQQIRRESVTSNKENKDKEQLGERTGSTGSKGQCQYSTPYLYDTYPTSRNISGSVLKQVDFLAVQDNDIHVVATTYQPGLIKLAQSVAGRRRGRSVNEKHPRLINSIYRADLSLKYELLVPPKKTSSNIINFVARLFNKTDKTSEEMNEGVTTHRQQVERIMQTPEFFVVQNRNARSNSTVIRQQQQQQQEQQKQQQAAVERLFTQSDSVPNVLSPTRPRLGTNESQKTPFLISVPCIADGEMPSHPANDNESAGTMTSRLRLMDDEPLPPTANVLDRLKRLGSIVGDQGSLAERNSTSRRSIAGPTPLAQQSLGFVLSALPPPPVRSPTASTPAAQLIDRPDSPHIPTPTRTGGSLSSYELDASTPDRYLENASALYILQPISVNTFRRLRPAEAMSFRYIDRTSSLSLCVSETNHSADLEEQRTADDEFEGGRGSPRSGGGESGSLMSQGEYGDYGTASMIQTHKRALVYQGGEWLINNPDRTVYTLLYTKHTKVGMKDFAIDFRAQMDADRLLREAVIILDTNYTHIYRIVQHLVSEIVDKDFDATGRGNDAMRKARCKDEAMKTLFVDKSVTVLARAIQGGCLSEMLDDTLDITMSTDQIWLCAFAQLHDITGRHVAFCRTSSPVNMGHISEELKFVVLIMTPTVEKSTKTALETARTFATLFLDVETRNQLSGALDEEEFRDILTDHAIRLHAIQEHPELVRRLTQKRASKVYFKSRCLSWYPGQGIYLDIKRRWPHYKSDYLDGIHGPNTVHKLLSTVVFLYFAVLLPTLAFGVLNDSNTAGKIGVQKHIYAQVFGGIMFGIFGGQPLLVIMTTAPLGLYMRILYSIANQFHVDFFAFYSCIGLWNCFFLSLYALMNTSCLTNLCTRTIQDIFEMFALFAFVVDGFTELMHNFGEHYFSEACSRQTGSRSGFWELTGKISGPAEHSSGTESSTTTMQTTLEAATAVFDYLTSVTSKFVKRAVELEPNGTVIANETVGTTAEEFLVTNASSATTPVATTIIQLIDEFLLQGNTTTTTSTSVFTTSAVTFNTTTANASDYYTTKSTEGQGGQCRRDHALLYLLLMLATWWTSLRLHGFAKTPYTNKTVREFLSDYSLPISIIAVSFIGRLVFGDVQLEQFTIYEYTPSRARIENLPLWCVFLCCGVGFIISLLFFFDTTITNSVVCRPTNKLRKGTTYDYDLLIVALINGCLSLFSLPWLYPTTPQSPLHLLGLADVEERVDAGHVYQAVVRVRETRLTTLIASVLIGLSLFMLPYPLAYISRPVLNGLFLYMAAMSIHDNQLMERIMLLFTEQTAYPPHHYIRTVPQRQLHIITMIQILQLVIICGMGLYGRNIYVEMLFPIVLCLMFPVRHSLMPKIIDIKYLESLEGLKTSTFGKRVATPAFEM